MDHMPLIALGLCATLVAVYLLHVSQKTAITPQRALGANPTKYIPFRLAKVDDVSHDTKIFTFALPNSNMCLGLPTGKHVVVRAIVNGEEVERKYTPISSDDDLGVFKLCIKVYFKNTHPRFPDGGLMSQYINDMKIGDTLDVRGPTGLITYHGDGAFTIKGKKVNVKHIGLLAGGTGITPCLQVIEQVLKNPADKSQLSLIFGNQSEADILLRERLDTLARDNAQFEVFYTLDKAPEGWTQGEGFISRDMCEKYLPAPGPNTIVLMCGPPPMIKYAATPNLTAIGHSSDRQVQF